MRVIMKAILDGVKLSWLHQWMINQYVSEHWIAEYKIKSR